MTKTNSNNHVMDCECWYCQHGVVIGSDRPLEHPTRKKKNTMKRIIVALALVAGVLSVGAAASATKPPTVNHPEDQCEGTFIKSQPPGSGFTVTAAYTGNMWIKIATQHVAVPAVTKGEVYTPRNVSSWPTNKNGRYQEISHVDYCIRPEVTTTTAPEVTTTTAPEVTTTTEPEVTTTTAPEVTTTTEPETRVTTTTTIPNECWLIGQGDTPYEGDWVLKVYGDPDAIGTHSISGILCGPPVVEVTHPPNTTTPKSTLPDTGGSPTTGLMLGLVALLGGGGLTLLTRRV